MKHKPDKYHEATPDIREKEGGFQRNMRSAQNDDETPCRLFFSEGLFRGKAVPATKSKTNPSLLSWGDSWCSTAISSLVAPYLTPDDVCTMCAVCVSWYSSCALENQHLWKEFVCKKYGRKYENYVVFTGDPNWRYLYAKVSTFIKNLRRGTPVIRSFERLLSPAVSSSYEGCLAMTTDCSRLIWENGKYLQCLDIDDGKELWKVDVGDRETQCSRPSVVVGKSKVFLHVDAEVRVFDLRNGDFIKNLELPVSIKERNQTDYLSTNMPLDVSLRNFHFTFLTRSQLHVFHSETLNYLFSIVHRELSPSIDSCDDIDFCWAGTRCCGGEAENGCSNCKLSGIQFDNKCPQCCRHIVTWLVKKSCTIKIWDIMCGSLLRSIKGHSNPIKKVRHVMSWKDISEYYLASLASDGTILIHDSSADFACLHVLKPKEKTTVFRMSFTATHLMTMTKGPDEEILLDIWKFDAKKTSRNKSGRDRKSQDKDDKCCSTRCHCNECSFSGTLSPKRDVFVKGGINLAEDFQGEGSSGESPQLFHYSQNSEVALDSSDFDPHFPFHFVARYRNSSLPGIKIGDTENFDVEDIFSHQASMMTSLTYFPDKNGDATSIIDSEGSILCHSAQAGCISLRCDGTISTSSAVCKCTNNPENSEKENDTTVISLQKENSFSISLQAYYADFIDGQLLALWLVHPFSYPSSAFQLSLSDWEVHDCIDFEKWKRGSNPHRTTVAKEGEERHSLLPVEVVGYRHTNIGNYRNSERHALVQEQGYTNETKGQHAAKPLGRASFFMKNRGDVWTLLDWKCLEVTSQGDLTVNNFCHLPQNIAIS